MKRAQSLAFTLALVCLCLPFVTASPAGAAAHTVLVSGMDRLYLSGGTSIDQDTDPYFTAIYDDVTHVVAILGHRGVNPDGDAGQAYLYQLSGTQGGDRVAQEIPTATINGVVYTDMNIANGLVPLFLTFGKRNGSPTFNFFSIFSAVSAFNAQGTLQDVDGDPDGLWDSVFVPAHEEPACVDYPEWQHTFPDALFDLTVGSAMRLLQDLGEGVQTFISFGSVFWMKPGHPTLPAGEVYLSINIPIIRMEGQGGDMLLVQAGGEILGAIPEIPAQFVEPPEPGFVGAPLPNPNPNPNPGSRPYYHKEMDIFKQICFILSARNTGSFYDAHRKMARLFSRTRAYSVVAIAVLTGLLALGIVTLRRRNFGKGL